MKKRKALLWLLLLSFALFFVFSIVNFKSSIVIFLSLLGVLICIKFFELFMIYYSRNKRIKLGVIELFRSSFWDFLISTVAVILIYLFVKYSYLLDFEPNKFVKYFFNTSSLISPYYIISLTYIISVIINDNRIFYLTKNGLVTRGNYFEDYFWKDFKEFSLIEEQSLIRFKKKNDKFLFVKYEESYFQENKTEILKELNKNILYV